MSVHGVYYFQFDYDDYYCNNNYYYYCYYCYSIVVCDCFAVLGAIPDILLYKKGVIIYNCVGFRKLELGPSVLRVFGFRFLRAGL